MNSVETYIGSFQPEVQRILSDLHAELKKLAPTAEEKIAYGIPTLKGRKNIIHFAAFKDHISIFPGSEAVAAFHDELSQYKTSKGTIQFSLDKPLPYPLIRKIMKFCVDKYL